jgi:hypothetical protein
MHDQFEPARRADRIIGIDALAAARAARRTVIQLNVFR